MTKTTESRYSEILRSKIRQGEGFMSSAQSAVSERLREKADLRRILPKSGILGAVAESTFGKPYQYRRKAADSKDSSKESVELSTKELKVIRVSSAITAKNSMVLPGMARDMNVMRQNIVRLTKNITGSAATKADAHFLRAKEREALYENSQERNRDESSQSKTPGSFLGNIFSGIGGVGGGMLSGLGSIVSGIFSSFGSIVGGVVGGGLRMFSGILGGLGLFAIPIAILTGSLLVALFKGIDFSKIGQEFSGLFGSMFSGITNMFSIDDENSLLGSIAKKIKSFFGTDSDNPDEPSFFAKVAKKLDEMFNTDKFTKGLEDIIEFTKTLYEDIAYQAKLLYREVMINSSAAFSVVGNIFTNTGKDITAAFFRWLDDNRQGLYMMIGGVVGSAFGIKGAVIGTVAGAAYAAIDDYLVSGDENRANAVKSLNKQISLKEERIAQLKAGSSPMSGDETIKKHEEELFNYRQLLAEKQAEIEARKPSQKLDTASLYSKYLKEQELKYPVPQKPTRIPMGTDKELLEHIGKLEGGKYGYNALVYGQEGKETPKSADLVNMKIEDVLKMQSKMIASGHQSSAVGKYQIIKSTLEENLAKAGLTKQDYFSPENQDKLAMVLLNNRKLAATENGVLNMKKFQKGLTQEWESLGKSKSSRVTIAENKLENAIDRNTAETKTLTDTLKEKSQDTMEDLLKALLQNMASMSTGSPSVNNVTNNTINTPVASPYNEDYYPLIFKNVTEGR